MSQCPDKTIKALDQLADLEDDFDDEGAVAPTKRALEIAKVVLCGGTCIGPDGTGGVDICWNSPGYYVLMNVDDDGRVQASGTGLGFGRQNWEEEYREILQRMFAKYLGDEAGAEVGEALTRSPSTAGASEPERADPGEGEASPSRGSDQASRAR